MVIKYIEICLNLRSRAREHYISQEAVIATRQDQFENDNKAGFSITN